MYIYFICVLLKDLKFKIIISCIGKLMNMQSSLVMVSVNFYKHSSIWRIHPWKLAVKGERTKPLKNSTKSTILLIVELRHPVILGTYYSTAHESWLHDVFILHASLNLFSVPSIGTLSTPLVTNSIPFDKYPSILENPPLKASCLGDGPSHLSMPLSIPYSQSGT